MSSAQVVVVPDVAQAPGCVTWWRLSGGVSLGRLYDEWEKRGLDLTLLPTPPSDVAALRRTLARLESPRTIVRSIPGQSGFAVVREEFHGQQATYAQLLAVTVADGAVRVGQCEMAVEEQQLQRSFVEQKQSLAAADVSAWLVRMADRLHAVRLRESGGIYFVPSAETNAAWGLIGDALSACSACCVYRIPAMRSDDAVAAILAALADDVQSTIDVMRGEMEKGELGVRALRTRVERCESLTQKIARYEELLGARLADLRALVDPLQANIVQAVMMADGEEE